MSTVETQRAVIENYGRLPLTFAENAGQARSDIRYLTNRLGYGVSFTAEEAMIVFSGNAREEQEGLALFLQFLGANAEVQIEGRRQSLEKVNFLVGNDPEKWHTGLSTYREVVYRELWPGVDLIFYGEGGKLKYDVMVQPGARLDDIQFAYRGAERLSLDEEGNLLIHTPYGILIEERPVSYQEIDGKKVVVESRFVVKQNAHGELVYGFEVGHGYHPDYGVVIDPSIAYSTYLGSTSTSTDTAAIAVDASGHAYVTGTSGPDFPVTPGAFQPVFAGDRDVIAAKLDPTGSFLIYSTSYSIS